MSLASGTSNDSVKCKTFVSEAEIEERKKRRQEEWEKVRKPEDPLEAPEEEYDPRSLYERLQEQKEKRQAEYEESHRLKNLIKGLDDDEVAFLELVDKTKIEMETKLYKEELKEIAEYRKAVAHLSEAEAEAKLKELRKNLNLQNSSAAKKSQQSLLAGALKRKSSTSPPDSKKLRSDSQSGESETNGVDAESSTVCEDSDSPTENRIETGLMVGRLQCLGVLPGLGAYSDSSDSENSSNSDHEKDSDLDLVGRRRLRVQVVQNHT